MPKKEIQKITKKTHTLCITQFFSLESKDRERCSSVIIVYSAKFCAPHIFLQQYAILFRLHLEIAFLFVIINKLMILNYISCKCTLFYIFCWFFFFFKYSISLSFHSKLNQHSTTRKKNNASFFFVV